MEHRQLWTAFLAGEEEAFSQLFFEFYEMLYHYGCRLVPTNSDLVRDVIQEFFLYLFEAKSSLTPRVKNLKAYLFVTFRRRLLQTVKKERKNYEALDDIDHLASGAFELGIEAVVIRKESATLNKKLVKKLLSELPPRQREIIYLRFYVGLSLAEIAEALDISYQVTANHVYRALKKLKSSHSTRQFLNLDVWLLLCFFSLLQFSLSQLSHAGLI